MNQACAAEFNFTGLAGGRDEAGCQDGLGIEARFCGPSALAADRQGGFYVADSLNHCIRRIDRDGWVSTFAGLGLDLNLDGINDGGAEDGLGPAARFNYPAGVAVDAGGVVFVSDAWNHTIRKITPDGMVSTYAGQAGHYGHQDGPAAEALFDDPCGIAVAPSGALFVAERGSHIIRKISRDGNVTTFAGSPADRGSADGTGVSARFNRPSGLCLDAQGNLWVADSGNHTIRLITPGGQVKTVAGIPGHFGYRDGDACSSLLFEPMGVAVDKQGLLYIADTFNNAIRRLGLDGQIETLQPVTFTAPPDAGNGPSPYAPSQFLGPSGLHVNAQGVVTVADAGNNLIQTGVEVARVGLGIALEGGVPVLKISGGMGRDCTIEVCTDPNAGAPWTPLFKLELTGETVSVPDRDALAGSFRLYRVRP